MAQWVRAGLAVAVAAGLAVLPACNRSNKIKVGVVTNCTADFWSICEAGANKAARDHDVDLVFRQPKEMDAAEQLPIVEGFLAQRCNGIAVSVINPKGQTPDLTRIAKEVPLVTMDNDADQTGRLCYIGIDNKEAGKAVGRLVKRALPGGGTVAMFIGSTSSANGQARSQGVLDALAGEDNAKGTDATHPDKPTIKGKTFGKYFLVDGAARTDDGKSDVATNNATDVLTRLDGVKDVALVGLYAYDPPAIRTAAASKNLVGKVKIVGFDEDFATLDGIRDGSIEGTVVQDPFMYGYKSVEVLAAVARGDKSKLPKDAIKYRVVTKDGTLDEAVAGKGIEVLKADDFEKKLRDDIASAKK